MSENQPYGVSEDAWYPPYTSAPPPPKEQKPFRLFMWTFLFVQAVFAWLVVVGIVSVASSTDENCTLSEQDCQAMGAAVGTFGVGILLFLWVMVDIILGIGRLVVRTSRK